jgi:DNA-binding NarL/FixJ family response regulator
MLSDIITDIVTSQADMEIVGSVADARALAATVAEVDADVVVVGLPDAELPAQYASLLGARPQTRLLGVSGDGRRAFLYELRPHRTALGEVSPQALVEAIRAAARPAAW